MKLIKHLLKDLTTVEFTVGAISFIGMGAGIIAFCLLLWDFLTKVLA